VTIQLLTLFFAMTATHQDLAEDPVAKPLFDKASEILGYDLLKVRLSLVGTPIVTGTFHNMP
jgi:hypothetical protein